MPRKSKNTDINVRSLVIFHRKKEKPIRKIAEILNLSKSTVQDICRRYFKDGEIEDKQRPGRPKKITETEKKFLLREIKQDPTLNSSELVTKLKKFNNIIVDSSTIRKTLKKNGYSSRVARKKPLLRNENVKKRFNFAKKYKNKDIEFWKRVIFVDESKFNMYLNDNKQVRVWRKKKTELDRKNINSTVKHGGKNVMCWGAMGHSGVGNLVFIDSTMTQKEYLNILKNNLPHTARKLDVVDDFYFYQDNDPKHKAWNVRSWLLYNCPHVIETPPQSPDINPIEHLWAYLEKKIRKNHHPTSVSELKTALEKEWNEIPQNFVKSLVESMSKRLREVYKCKGLHTKY